MGSLEGHLPQIDGRLALLNSFFMPRKWSVFSFDLWHIVCLQISLRRADPEIESGPSPWPVYRVPVVLCDVYIWLRLRKYRVRSTRCVPQVGVEIDRRP